MFFDLLPKQRFAETWNQAYANLPDLCACLNTHIGMVSRTFILGIMRGVGEMGGSRLGTSSCPIDLTFLPVITINLRNLETEWADLNPQSAFLQTGLVYISHFLMNQPFLAGWRPLVEECIAYFGVPSHLFFFFFCLNN